MNKKILQNAAIVLIAVSLIAALLYVTGAPMWFLRGLMEPRYDETTGHCIKNCLGAPEYPE